MDNALDSRLESLKTALLVVGIHEAGGWVSPSGLEARRQELLHANREELDMVRGESHQASSLPMRVHGAAPRRGLYK